MACSQEVPADRENNSSSIYPRTCANCSKTFKNRHSFWNHRIVCSGALIICEDCGHVYRSRLAFSEHNCQKRKEGSCKRLTKCIHPHCENKFFRRTEMLKHMEVVHANNIQESMLTFENFEEFEKWKEKESQKCFVNFRKQRGTKRLKDSEYSSFICQFDAPNRKKGSKIPNYCCPARMQVSTNDKGTVTVRYISTHNHMLTDANTKYHPYSKTVVSYIKELLNKGVNPRTIYNILQSRTDEPDFLQLKDHSITVKYINNLKYQLKTKGELNVRMPRNKNKHKSGVEIPISSVIALSSSTWHVSSEDDENMSFVVERFHEECPQPENCLYRCNYSACDKLCSHMYSCSCSDSSSLCTHIHRVQSLSKKKQKYCSTNSADIMEMNDSSVPIDVSQEDIIVSVIVENEKSADSLDPFHSSPLSFGNPDVVDLDSEENTEIVIEHIPSDYIEVKVERVTGEFDRENLRSAGNNILTQLNQIYQKIPADCLTDVNEILRNAVKLIVERTNS